MTARLLRHNRNFRLVLAASAVSNLGDGVSALAFPWLAALLTRDAMLIALVAMAGRLPWFLFALPAGVLADRADRRRLMVCADILRMTLTLGIVAMVLSLPPLPFADSAGPAPILSLAVVSFLLGTAEVLRDNAAQTVLPAIVDHADLERANGRMWSVEQVTGQFAGPPLAGALIAAGIALPFGFDALTFAVAALLVWLVALPPQVLPRTAAFWPAFREGVTWITANRLVPRLALMLAVVNAGYFGVLTVLTLYAQEVLGLDALGFGLLLAAGATGGGIGGLVAPRLAARLGMRRSLCLSLVIFTCADLGLALTSVPLVAAASQFAGALASLLWNVVTVSFRQRTIPSEILGRVNAIYRFFGWGAMPFGAVVAGAIVSSLEGPAGRDLALRAPILLAAVLSVLLALYAMLRLPPDRS